MTKKHVSLGLLLVLVLLLLVGCDGGGEESFVGATASGTLDEEEPGSELAFTTEVENEGDPVGVDFRGLLIEGSVKLQIEVIVDNPLLHGIVPIADMKSAR